MTNEELTGGAIIKTIFDDYFMPEVMGLQVQGLEDATTYRKVRFLMKNTQGIDGGVYVPNGAFAALVEYQVIIFEGLSGLYP